MAHPLPPNPPSLRNSLSGTPPNNHADAPATDMIKVAIRIKGVHRLDLANCTTFDVKTPAFFLSVESTLTIGQLKQKVSEAKNIPVALLICSIAGNTFPDTTKLNHVKVETLLNRNTVINMIEQVPSPPPHHPTT